MANQFYLPSTGELTLNSGTSTAKTLAVYTAPTNSDAIIRGARLTFKDAVDGDEEVRFQIIRLSAATAGTSSAGTMTKALDSLPNAQGTWRINYTDEPTLYGSILHDELVHPRSGRSYSGLNFQVPAGTKIGFRVLQNTLIGAIETVLQATIEE